MAETALTKYQKKMKSLQEEFSTWRDHFTEISDYVIPRKGRFLYKDTKANDGGKRHQDIIDGTAGRALKVLASGMQSGLTSPARPWFRLGLDDKDLEQFTPVKEWLEAVRSTMMRIMQRSNFYNSTHSNYGELGSFGTSAMLIEDDPDTIIRCYPFTCGEYYLDTNNKHIVDTLYRVYPMKAYNIVKEFGEDKVSESVKKDVKTNQGMSYFDIAHIIQPREDRDPTKIDFLNMPWESVQYEYNNSQGRILRESGFNTFPAVAPRWDVTGSEIYGRSPGMDGLGDTKMLQTMQKKSLKALAKIIDPPMNAPSTLEGKHKSIISGGVTYVDASSPGQTFTPTHEVNLGIQDVEYKIERVQAAINETYFKDLFTMLASTGRSGMTATEVIERHEEKLIILGPVVERFQHEHSDRSIERIYNIAFEKGLFPDPPEELRDTGFDVEYISLLAQAQKTMGLTAINETIGFVRDNIDIFPEARYKIDINEAIDQHADVTGIPTKIIVPTDEAMEMQAADVAAQQQQQQLDQAQELAQGVKTLSETNLDGNNALNNLGGQI